jgi:hypothetical protein
VGVVAKATFVRNLRQDVATDRRTLRSRSGRRVGLVRLTRRHRPNTGCVNRPTNEEVASTRAKQSSRGRGTTEYENRLAPRGAGGQSIRLQPHTSNACRFFTCRIPMAPIGTLNRQILWESFCSLLVTGVETDRLVEPTEGLHMGEQQRGERRHGMCRPVRGRSRKRNGAGWAAAWQDAKASSEGRDARTARPDF